MRGMCLLTLVLVAGCASGGNPVEDSRADVYYDGAGLNYETTRPDEVPVDTIVVDLTLVELDLELAERLLGIGAATDIAPRSFREPMGEIAAVNAVYGYGRVILRPTFYMPENGETPLRYLWDVIYLRDWEGTRFVQSPVFDTYREGVDGKLKVFPVVGGVNVVLDAVSAHGAWPMAGFTTSLGTGNQVKIQVPELSIVERVASESLSAGETAMFQLSRAPYGEGTRIRLLFVRLRGIEE